MADGDSTDCSRLAWLLLRCNQDERALEIVECGLKLDASNEHCQNIKLKIWRRRAEAFREANNMAAFVDASIHIAEVPSSDFRELSEASNAFNQFGNRIEPDPDRRRLLALRLGRVMEGRIGDADATDCSRLGWVWMNAGETERARRVAEMGLRLDPDNEHCLRLKARVE